VHPIDMLAVNSSQEHASYYDVDIATGSVVVDNDTVNLVGNKLLLLISFYICVCIIILAVTVHHRKAPCNEDFIDYRGRLSPTLKNSLRTIYNIIQACLTSKQKFQNSNYDSMQCSCQRPLFEHETTNLLLNLPIRCTTTFSTTTTNDPCHCCSKLDYETTKLLQLTKSLALRAAISPTVDLLVTATIASQMGDAAVQAYLTSRTVVFLTSFVCDGIYSAAFTPISKLSGGKDFYSAGRLVHVASLIELLFSSIILYPLWFLCMDQILMVIFRVDATVAQMGLQYARVFGITHVISFLQQMYASILDVSDHEDFNTLLSASNKFAFLLASAVPCFSLPNLQLYIIGILELLCTLVFVAIHILYPLHKKWLEPYWDGICTCWSSADYTMTKELVINGFAVSIASTVAHFEWQILSFFAASAGVKEVSAWFLIGTIWEFAAALSIGLSAACQIRVAKHLGRGKPRKAKESALQSLRIVGGLTGIVASCLLIFRYPISTWFAKDETIVMLIYDTLPILMVGAVAEGFCYVGYYTVYAQGRFNIMTMTETFQCVAVTVPLASVMVFVWGVGVQGIASSLMIGYITSGTVLLSIVLTSDWDKIAREHQGAPIVEEKESLDYRPRAITLS